MSMVIKHGTGVEGKAMTMGAQGAMANEWERQKLLEEQKDKEEKAGKLGDAGSIMQMIGAGASFVPGLQPVGIGLGLAGSGLSRAAGGAGDPGLQIAGEGAQGLASVYNQWHMQDVEDAKQQELWEQRLEKTQNAYGERQIEYLEKKQELQNEIKLNRAAQASEVYNMKSFDNYSAYTDEVSRIENWDASKYTPQEAEQVKYDALNKAKMQYERNQGAWEKFYYDNVMGDDMRYPTNNPVNVGDMPKPDTVGPTVVNPTVEKLRERYSQAGNDFNYLQESDGTPDQIKNAERELAAIKRQASKEIEANLTPAQMQQMAVEADKYVHDRFLHHMHEQNPNRNPEDDKKDYEQFKGTDEYDRLMKDILVHYGLVNHGFYDRGSAE